MSRRYIDFDLIKEVPNKYNLTPENIKTISVLDWEALKKHTWFNQAMDKPCWCKLTGCNDSGKYDDWDEFWIGFYEDGEVDCHFSACEGMCNYIFSEFYSAESIENKYDMQVQVNAIKFLNGLIDDGIVSKPKGE